MIDHAVIRALILEGYRNQEIGERFGVATDTIVKLVRNHRLSVPDRQQRIADRRCILFAESEDTRLSEGTQAYELSRAELRRISERAAEIYGSARYQDQNLLPRAWFLVFDEIGGAPRRAWMGG